MLEELVAQPHCLHVHVDIWQLNMFKLTWLSCPYMLEKSFKNLLLRNWWTNFNKTWREALMAKVLQYVYKS